jgi:hypothetical protein
MLDRVWIVEAEHPFEPYRPLEVFATEHAAINRAVELTNDALKAFWEVEFDDEPLVKPPEVKPTNWRELVDKYGEGGPSNNIEQDDGFGSWWVAVTEKEVTDA